MATATVRHKSALKATRQTKKRTATNKNHVTQMRNMERKVREAVAAGDNAQARKVLSEAQSKIMKTVTKGIVKLETASRKVKRLAALVKSMIAA